MKVGLLAILSGNPPSLSDSGDDILLHGHGIGCDYLSGYIDFIDKPRYGLYLIAFLSADFGSQCDAGASVEKLRKLLHPVGTSAGSSIPCSTRQRAASDGTPFFNMPNLRNLLRLCLPNSIISVRHTHFEVRASIISMMLASSL